MFSKNRERLQEADVFQKFITKLLKHEKVKPLLSDEHFSVDGTLIEAWASHKSSNGRKPRRTMTARTFTASYARTIRIKARPTLKPSSTARRKARGQLSYLGHALMENRNGLAVGGMVTQADGTAERRASEAMLKNKPKAQSASPSARTKPTTPAITLRRCAG